MRDTLPLLDSIPFPAIRRGRLDTLQVNVGYRCNQSCVHCHVDAGPNRTEEMCGAIADSCSTFLDAPAHRHARHHRRRAGAQSAFPPAGDAARAHSASRVMDRCNLTILERARPGGPRRIPRRRAASRSSPRCRAICEDNVERQRGKGVFDGSIRGLQAAQRARLRPRRSGAPAQSGLQSAGAVAAAAASRARSRLQARARRATTASCSTDCSCSPTCRSSASARCWSSKGEFDGYLDLLQRRASRRQSRRRHVPQPDLGRLARLSSTTATSTRCSTCRWRAAATSACISPICSTPISTAIRSASPAIATAAPPARVRAAAAR